MSLREFLSDKTGTAEDLLTLAKGEKVIVGRLIHRDSMNSLLASARMYNSLKAIAANTTDPDSDAMAAFLDSTEYNFIIGDGTTTGDRQIAAMDKIIAKGGDLGQGLAVIRPVILSMANRESEAYPNVTLHDIKLAKGTIKRKSVTQTDGILTINTNADCETHNPQVYQYIESADFYKRVAGFRGVGVAGKYQIEVPRVGNLFVDDAYGVVS